MDHMNAGNLKELSDLLGSISEIPLREITTQIVWGLHFSHLKAKFAHNGLSASQILFDKKGNIKIGLALTEDYIQNKKTRIFDSRS